MRNAYKKQEGQRPLGSRRLWWEGNIKIDIEEIICHYVD